MNPNTRQEEAKGNPVEMFQNSWNLYRKIVDHDYMFHTSIYADLGRYLEGLQEVEPLAVVELGCGDASQSMEAFKRCKLASYLGLDLSEPALELAARNLAGLPCPVRLELADMLEGLSLIEAPVDVIFSGFALHHLAVEDKARFFALSRNALKPGGLLLLTDVMREPGQSRDDYLKAYLGYAEQHWQSLVPAEFTLLREHVGNFDYPETAETYERMARESGFASSRQLSRHTWHQTWIYRDGD